MSFKDNQPLCLLCIHLSDYIRKNRLFCEQPNLAAFLQLWISCLDHAMSRSVWAPVKAFPKVGALRVTLVLFMCFQILQLMRFMLQLLSQWEHHLWTSPPVVSKFPQNLQEPSSLWPQTSVERGWFWPGGSKGTRTESNREHTHICWSLISIGNMTKKLFLWKSFQVFPRTNPFRFFESLTSD